MTCRIRTLTALTLTIILAASSGVLQAQTKGQPPKSQIFGHGHEEFSPWVLGPTM